MSEDIIESSQDAKWAVLNSQISTLKSVAIISDSLSVGRSQVCDIVLTESTFGSHANILKSVSKNHFTIFRKPDSLFAYLKDTSKNGTYVNGKKVQRNGQVLLKTNDKISMGQINPIIYIFELLLTDNLPKTLTPLSNLEVTPKYINVLPVWGRLLSCLEELESCDLHKDTFRVGRSRTCDLSIEQTKLTGRKKLIFSKEHFIIGKDPGNNIAYITDLSRGGTYINNVLIGKNKNQILQHNDRIAIGPKLQVFIYKCMYDHDTNFLPPELKAMYEPSTILGKGAVGEVRLAYEKLTCKMVAIKKIIKGRSTLSQKHELNHPSKIQTEIDILSTLKFPFIISMMNIVETPKEVFIVLDYMRGGELTNRILSHQPMTESNAKFLFYQIVLAVQYLHSKGVTHRDLKPENVLLYSDETETLVKVSDFGLSKVTEDDDMMRTVCGTMSYIAPEILNRHVSRYNKQVDVWSLGVILFYMLGKELPFVCKEKNGELEQMILKGKYSMNSVRWRETSAYARDLVKRMLTVDPENRINLDEVLKHFWLSKDLKMQLGVKALYETILEEMEDNAFTYNLEPPLKQIRLSYEDSSLSSH
ncbi:unnamed protein product [Phyllotreta striolata]|uniref:Uncharacterized protein n=1 Tax=Phyllotreta striolata TaxID=444603 RepID=A0A9N9TI93_PHYSR|nr:unnamed protein product [Phyllotreta striolata]